MYWQLLSAVCPLRNHLTWHAEVAGIVNKVYRKLREMEKTQRQNSNDKSRLYIFFYIYLRQTLKQLVWCTTPARIGDLHDDVKLVPRALFPGVPTFKSRDKRPGDVFTMTSIHYNYQKRPFPSSKIPARFQNEAKCKTFQINMIFI